MFVGVECLFGCLRLSFLSVWLFLVALVLVLVSGALGGLFILMMALEEVFSGLSDVCLWC